MTKKYSNTFLQVDDRGLSQCSANIFLRTATILHHAPLPNGFAVIEPYRSKEEIVDAETLQIDAPLFLTPTEQALHPSDTSATSARTG